MFGLNPVATGLLLGRIAGPGGMLIGAGIGALYDNAQGAKRDAISAANTLRKDGVRNANALVEDAYSKKRNAKGLGEAISTPSAMGATGMGASQTGAILTSTTGNQNSLI